MPVRKIGIAPATCPGKVGQGGADPCQYNRDLPYKIVLKKRNGDNPFTTALLIVDETAWDTALALTTAADPDNIFLSPKVFDAEITPGEPNIIESSSGQKNVTHYADSVFSVSFDGLSEAAANNLAVTIRDNSANLEFMYFANKGNKIICALDSTGAPKWIPVNLATCTGRGRAGGRGALEMLMVQLHIFEEQDFNWGAFAPTNWIPNNKVQAFET